MLAHLNAYLIDQELDKYLTMFYGVIDVDNIRLRYSNGGHFPNPVLFDGGNAQFSTAAARHWACLRTPRSTSST